MTYSTDRPIWEALRLAFAAYDEEAPRTQEEIDDYIADIFVDNGLLNTTNLDDIPQEYTRRRREWYDPFDLFDWIIQNGIPISCVYVYITEGNEDIDRRYIAYITNNTP